MNFRTNNDDIWTVNKSKNISFLPYQLDFLSI